MSKRINRTDLMSRLTTEVQIENNIAQRATTRRRLAPLLVPDAIVAERIPLLNAGTIVTIVSPKPTDYLEGLAAAIKAGDAAKTRVYCDAVTSRTRHEILKRHAPFDVSRVPSIIDVLYGNTVIAKNLVLAADSSVALSCATWSGGKLDGGKFAVVQHNRDKRGSDASVLTLLVPPKLSKIEKAMIRAVPAELSEIHVKGPSVSWTAAGIIAKWESPARGEQLSTISNIKEVDPYYEKQQQYTTMQQQQVQQNDTQQQQQKQQFQDNQTQQQQQQQQQQETQQQQQQQMQLNQEQIQQQQQQQQQDQGQQDQHQFQDRHAADCAMQNQSGRFWDDLDGGLVFRQFEEEIYDSVLQKIDFEALDATQSVKELVRLRERLITVGMP